MKRFMQSLAVVAALFSLVSVAVPVSAATNINGTLCNYANNKSEGTPSICKDNATSSSSNPIVGPNGIFTRIMRIFSVVIGIAAVIISIISGLRFVLANGDANSIATARKGLLYALVGLGVAAFAQSIVSFVLSKL